MSRCPPWAYEEIVKLYCTNSCIVLDFNGGTIQGSDWSNLLEIYHAYHVRLLNHLADAP